MGTCYSMLRSNGQPATFDEGRATAGLSFGCSMAGVFIGGRGLGVHGYWLQIPLMMTVRGITGKSGLGYASYQDIAGEGWNFSLQ